MSKKIAPVKTDDKLPALVELFQENGVSILFNPNNRDDALISLTGIYQASGAGKNKSPHDWMRTNITQEFLCAFIEMGQNRVSPGSAKDPVERSKFQKCDFHTSENSPVERAKSLNLIKVYRGIQFNGGETFAHNEIALEYAAYLSPILRIKINRAFKESLQKQSELEQRERWRREEMSEFIPDKAKSRKALRSRKALKKLAILAGHSEWYDEETGRIFSPHFAGLLHKLEKKKMHPTLMELVRESNHQYGDGSSRYRTNQLLDGKAEEVFEEVVRHWQMLISRDDAFDDFKELKAVHDFFYPDSDKGQLALFKPRIQMIPAQFEEVSP